MKKIKYFYNTHTLRFEKLITPIRVKILRWFGVLSGLVVGAFIVIVIYNKFLPQPKVIESNRKYQQLESDYKQQEKEFNNLQQRIFEMQQKIAALEQRDNEVYRSIFEANPVPDSARVKAILKQKEYQDLQKMDEHQLRKDIMERLNNLDARIAFQMKSYESISRLIKNQDQKLASIPAIQPVSNKQLNRVASGFGSRIDPVYGTVKMHKGLDFAAPQGTPIYATGDGRVIIAEREDGGYGNHVVINHGYGYKTLYGHMVKINAQPGKMVKRGEVIGWVGSTGKSTGPHCHYEVHVNDEAVNPVYFFYNDLNAEQYDRLLKIAASGSAKSFD